MTLHEIVAAAAVRYAWMADAACRRYPRQQRQLEGYYTAPPPPEVLALCGRCPVRRECLDYAYEHNIEHGWLGGLAPARREELGDTDTAMAWIAQRRNLPIVD